MLSSAMNCDIVCDALNWVHSIMDATGCTLVWVDLLAFDRFGMLRRSIASSAIKLHDY